MCKMLLQVLRCHPDRIQYNSVVFDDTWTMMCGLHMIFFVLFYFSLFRVIDSSMKNFKAFFRWLYVGKLSTNINQI